MAKTCMWCKADCSFMAATDGMCLSCGDRIQAAGWPWVYKVLVEGAKQVEELNADNMRLTAELAAVRNERDQLADRLEM